MLTLTSTSDRLLRSAGVADRRRSAPPQAMARSRSVPARANATDDAPSKSPVRARGVRTRAKLIDAARRVFERDGYLEARVADIAAAAGVAHGSFYTYFDSKEDVFREMATGLMAEFETELGFDEEGTPPPASGRPIGATWSSTAGGLRSWA